MGQSRTIPKQYINQMLLNRADLPPVNQKIASLIVMSENEGIINRMRSHQTDPLYAVQKIVSLMQIKLSILS